MLQLLPDDRTFAHTVEHAVREQAHPLRRFLLALLRSKRAMLSRHMKIDSVDLRWYAAFHNEGHHPHVHLMVYSAKDNDGFLTKAGIEAMRSELAHDIFRQDFAQLYEGQNLARSTSFNASAITMFLILFNCF